MSALCLLLLVLLELLGWYQVAADELFIRAFYEATFVVLCGLSW